jgi:hypothetical protein
MSSADSQRLRGRSWERRRFSMVVFLERAFDTSG